MDDIYVEITVTIPYNTELIETRKIRDAKKAFEYAKLGLICFTLLNL